jgi:hypothetical protein
VLFPGQQLWAGILVGVLVAGFGLLLWFQPQLRVLLGVLIAVLSLVSFVTSDFGGLFVGMLMGLLGGSLAIGWMADPPPSRRERRRHLLAVGGGQAPAVIDLRDASASPAEPSTGLPRPRPAPAEEHPGTEGIRGAADATGPAAPPGD